MFCAPPWRDRLSDDCWCPESCIAPDVSLAGNDASSSGQSAKGVRTIFFIILIIISFTLYTKIYCRIKKYKSIIYIFQDPSSDNTHITLRAPRNNHFNYYYIYVYVRIISPGPII